MTDQQKNAFCVAVEHAIQSNNETELAIGFVMYQYVRKLTARQFAELCERNIKGERFDDMIKESIGDRK